MAISLIEQLVQLRQIKDGTDFASILDEVWTSPTFGHGGEKAGTHWDSDRPRTIYHSPFINVIKKGKEDNETREKATQMFYDFYAMELMHRLLGSPRQDPDLNSPKYAGQRTPQQQAKIKSAVQTAAMQGANPMGAMFVGDWGNVEDTPAGISMVPAQLRKVIDQVYEEVVIQLTRKMMTHLRLTLVSEFRYIVTHASDWRTFRHKLVSIYNMNGGKISKNEFEAAIAEKIPGMKPHVDSVKRLLQFCKHYDAMSPDPADAIPANEPPPTVGEPVEPELTPEPDPEPEPDPQSPSEPDDTDYDMPQVEIPPGADWGDEPHDYSDEVEKEKTIQWIKTHKKISEGIKDPSYAAGRISPHTVLAVKTAINKSGLTWNDILLAYQNLNWGGSYGGPKWGEGVASFIKLMPHSKNEDVEDMAGLVDHIYDLEHNTGELLNKGGMYVSPTDLDRRSKVTSLSRYLPSVSPLVQRLILRVLGYVSKHPDLEKDIRKVTQSPTQAFTPEQQQFLAKNKFEKSDAGEEWTTQAPYENKKEKIVQNQYTIKFHTNGIFSAEDTIDADVKVFDNWNDIEGWVMNHQSSFVKPQSGMSYYEPAKQMSAKEQYFVGKTKIKLDASKETELLEKCNMAWRPSNHYYKAYFSSDRFQFFAFSDGTFMGCMSSTKAPGPTFNNWTDAFTYCKSQTANALPNEDYAEGKAWIGLSITAPAPHIVPSQIMPVSPSVGSIPPTEYTLSPVEINTLQIIAAQSGGAITVEPKVMPEGMTVLHINVDSSGVPMNFSVLAVGKKAIAPTGKKYAVQHAVYGGQKENWSFANWNQTLAFVKNNFSLLTQATSAVINAVTHFTSSPLFAQPSTTPLPPPSPSKAVYKAHLGLNKPPAHTIRLTEEDEQIMTGLGFEPTMLGSDVWYKHKTIGDIVKFFPNDVAKIMFIKTNNSVVITKTPPNGIEKALAWLQANYSGATKSPIASAPQTSASGSKAGAMYEKYLVNKGFSWDAATGKYFQTGGEMGHTDTIKIAPFPKSTFSDGNTGETKTFGSLPALANFLKGYDGLKKKLANPVHAVAHEVDTALGESGFKLVGLTAPESLLTGHVYLNDLSGETITYYKSTGTSYSNKLDGEILQFVAPDGLIKYLTSKPSLKKTENSLSQTEMDAIADVASSYDLKATIDYLGPPTTGTPFMVILDDSGKKLFNIRKLSGKFLFNKFGYTPDVDNGMVESVLFNKDWDSLVKEMHVQFSILLHPTMTVPSKDESTLSQTEMMAISKLAKKYMLGTTQPLVSASEPSSIIIQSNMGSNVWAVRKYHSLYEIIKIIGGKIWEVSESVPTFAKMLMDLNKLFDQYIPTPPKTPEHKGITPEEYQQIKEAVDSYGKKFWTQYIKASNGQTSYVEIHENGHGVIFSVGALGNIYQINDANNNPKDNSPTLNGIISRIHDRLADMAGQITIAPNDLLEIINLTHKMGFDYIPKKGNEHYTFVDDDSIIEIKYNSVRYTIGGVFGPIYTNSSKSFINWFKNTYMAGKVPDTAEKFADNILKVMESAGFLDKSKLVIVHHEKINAIKAMRFYIMQVTGGPCGLAKTKWAAENFSAFLGRIKTDGLPNMDADAPDLLTQFGFGSSKVSVSHKLLQEEQDEIGKIVSKYSPAIKYEFTSTDTVIIYVANLTHYKVAKEEDVYRVYTDKDGKWVIQNQASTYPELATYLEDMLAHIKKAIENSKLKQPLVLTTPSQDLDKLSVSEVVELKVLIKKFGLPVATSYSKKLMEDKIQGKDAYSLTIMDDPHKVYIKVTKANGEYIISKGFKDAYFPLKKFYHFDNTIAYLDYFLNSYLMPTPEKESIEKIPDDEFKQIKDLAEKYNPKAKVRRKYMTSKGEGKVPYVFLDGLSPFANLVISKTGTGVYKLFTVEVKEEWHNVATTNSWEGMYEILDDVLQGKGVPPEKEKHNQPVLNSDQFEWLETFMKTHKPGVFVKKWGNGVVGGYDPSNKINGDSNTLFIIYFPPGDTNQRILEVHTKDGGVNSDKYPFHTFEALSQFIIQNIDVVTQLLKGEVIPESKLAELMTKTGFEYKIHHTVDTDEGSKAGTIYENDKNERLYLFDDGSSLIWYKNHADSETYKKKFANIAELVGWMEEHYQGKPPEDDYKKIKEYLASLDFKIEGHKSDQFSTMWIKTIHAAVHPIFDHVHLHADGKSKVSPSPLIGDATKSSSPFFFDTAKELKDYLMEKYSKGDSFCTEYLNGVLVKGKFQKIEDQLCQMGFKWVNDKMIIAPFPSGGIMQTVEGVEPKLSFSFANTYDLAKRIELFLESKMSEEEYFDPTTGDDELDGLIDEYGFKFQGQQITPDHGNKLVFRDGFGTDLHFYVNDKTSSLQFHESYLKSKKGIAFTTIDDLKSHLKKYIDKKDPDKFFGNNKKWKALEAKIIMYGFKPNAQDPATPYIKIFTDEKGDAISVWNNETGAYKVKGNAEEYFKDWDALSDYIDTMKQKTAAGDKGFSKYYYGDLGNFQTSYTIRLTEEDDKLMEKMGWTFMPTYKTSLPSAYYNAQGYRALFYNRAIDASKPVCDIFKPNVGGKIHIQLTGNELENPHKVVQYLQQYPDAVPGSKDKQSSPESELEVPVAPEEIQKTMDSIGFKSHGIAAEGGHMFKTLSGYRVITIQPATGNVTYAFLYNENPTTGAMAWGQTVFKGWKSFVEFLHGQSHPKPKYGKLTYTPHPTTSEVPKLPAKMPFSGFDYEGWAKDMGHNPKATIKLVPDDDMMLQKLKWILVQANNSAYYYINNDTGDRAYFFVDGHAQLVPKGKTPITLPKVKMVLDMIWAEHYGSEGASDAGPPPDPESSKVNVIVALNELGFFSIVSSGGAMIFEKKTPELKHVVRWDKSDNTLDYMASKTSDPSVVTMAWLEDVSMGLAMLEHIFTPKLKKKKVLAGTENMPWSGVDYVSTWKAYSSNQGLVLNTKDEAVLTSMGWIIAPFPEGYDGYCYKHGNEALAFYSTGKTVYWSNFGKPPTQSWTSPEDAVRWLWKNNGSVENKNATGEMPWSNTDYKSLHKIQMKTLGNFAISLIPQDESVLKKIGFEKSIISSEKNPAFKIQYYKTTKNCSEVLYFFADGQATYWVNGFGPKYYAIESLMKLMWDKHGPHV
jgi:hypothetical protein